MTMHDTRHPDDERLAALAGADDEAQADTALHSHVDACERCSSLLTELTTLRAALAELPDLAPSRPIQLVPPVEEPVGAGSIGWARRLFAPVFAVGASLVLVGAVGLTLAPTTMEIFQNVGENLSGGEVQRPAGDVNDERDRQDGDDGDLSIVERFLRALSGGGAGAAASPQDYAVTDGASEEAPEATSAGQPRSPGLAGDSPGALAPTPTPSDASVDGLFSAGGDPDLPWLVSLLAGIGLIAAAAVLRLGIAR
jgi:hypothetical protein